MRPIFAWPFQISKSLRGRCPLWKHQDVRFNAGLHPSTAAICNDVDGSSPVGESPKAIDSARSMIYNNQYLSSLTTFNTSILEQFAATCSLKSQYTHQLIAHNGRSVSDPASMWLQLLPMGKAGLQVTRRHLMCKDTRLGG